jgi:hypothetical protein
MTHDTESGDFSPPPLHVQYSVAAQTFRGFAILAVGALALIIPFVAEGEGPKTWKLPGY